MSIRIWWFIWARTNSPDSPLVFTADKYGTAVPGCAQRKPREQLFWGFAVLPISMSWTGGADCNAVFDHFMTIRYNSSNGSCTVRTLMLPMQWSPLPIMEKLWLKHRISLATRRSWIKGFSIQRIFHFRIWLKSHRPKKNRGVPLKHLHLSREMHQTRASWCCAWTWNFCSS